MKKLLSALGVCLLAAGASQAAVIFNDTFGDVTLGTATETDAVNGGFGTVDISATGNSDNEADGVLTHKSTGSNDRSGILSSTAFDVSSATSFTVTWVVNSYTLSSSNGFQLGLSSTASSFDGLVSFVFEGGDNTANNLFDVRIDGVTYADDAAQTSTTTRDGFTFTATFDTTGITYSASDATLTGGTIAYTDGQTYASLFDSTMYVGANTQASGSTDAKFVLDSISVTAIPEPATIGLLSLGTVALLAFRRHLA
jgi:hypothetical protein